MHPNTEQVNCLGLTIITGCKLLQRRSMDLVVFYASNISDLPSPVWPLHSPSPFYYLPLHGGNVVVGICLSAHLFVSFLVSYLVVYEQHNSKTYWWIFFNFSHLVHRTWLKFGDVNAIVTSFKATLKLWIIWAGVGLQSVSVILLSVIFLSINYNIIIIYIFKQVSGP